MAIKKLKECPVNAALAKMREKDPNFEIKEFWNSLKLQERGFFIIKTTLTQSGLIKGQGN